MITHIYVKRDMYTITTCATGVSGWFAIVRLNNSRVHTTQTFPSAEAATEAAQSWVVKHQRLAPPWGK